MEIIKITDGIIRIRAEKHDSLLNRYNILNAAVNNKYDASLEAKEDKNNISISTDEFEVLLLIKENNGYELSFEAKKDERFYGLGDATRDSVMVRGKKCLMNVSNISAYGPQPILLSSRNFAILVNTTYKSLFDVCADKKDTVRINVNKDELDLYIFKAKSLKELIMAITDVTGKPVMLPAFAYGFTLIQNENTDAEKMLDNARLLRDRNIPCDTLGLEPGWMETYYDTTNNKKWNTTRFKLPSWHNEEYCGTQSFFYPLREKGLNLSLWLCENYDVFYEEERKLGNETTVKSTDGFGEDAEIFDTHLNAAVYTDNITEINRPWFDHLKKFVTQGAAAFKLDGYTQVLEHPDRYWGMKYHDDEIHNIYPVILEKQMKEGFEEFTGRRSFISSAGSYIGTQRYSATWAGDTGGGPRSLVSTLNLAMCGHTNTTCDMDITSPASVHYSFLLTYTLLNVWAYYTYPWNLSKEKEEMFRSYTELRSSLFPYIYKFAHDASVTGIPVVRPLQIEYPNDRRFDNVTNEYMLGDSLLVVPAFNSKEGCVNHDYIDSDDYKADKGDAKVIHVILPKGKWYDYFTDEEYEGEFDYNVLPNKGGALFVKEGSIIVTMKHQQYINEKEHEYIVNVYPGKDNETEIYEDDQYTYDYLKGGFTTTKISTKNGEVKIEQKQGSYSGRENNGSDIFNNSIPQIRASKNDIKMEVVQHRK